MVSLTLSKMRKKRMNSSSFSEKRKKRVKAAREAQASMNAI